MTDEKPDSDNDPIRSISKFISFVIGMFITAWAISALASLALVVAIIYFLISAAGVF